MASLARQLALRSRAISRKPTLSASLLPHASRRAVARYYSSGPRPPPEGEDAHKGSTSSVHEQNGSAAEDYLKDTEADTPDVSNVEVDFNAVLSLIQDPSYISNLNQRFAAAFPEYPQDLSANVKAKLLVDLDEGRKPTLPSEDEAAPPVLMINGRELSEAEAAELVARQKLNAAYPRDLPFPDLSEPVPLFDLKETITRPATAQHPFPSTITIRNDPSIFVAQGRWQPRDPAEAEEYRLENQEYEDAVEDLGGTKEEDEDTLDVAENKGYGLEEEDEELYNLEENEDAENEQYEDEEDELMEDDEDDLMEDEDDSLGRFEEASVEKEDGKNEVDERTEEERDVLQMPWQTQDDSDNTIATRKVLTMAPQDIGNLHVYTLMSRRVGHQTAKGKIFRHAQLICVGNGDGLVGYGYSKALRETPGKGGERAFIEAVRSMDYVDRFEDRTVWTHMEGKLGATRIILRPRPAGFGLHCNPYIHQICKAAGIKDLSAKVWGSRTPMNVIKLTFRMLQAGNAPQAMGDGLGGPGRKLDKGSGMRSKNEIERERGRKLIPLRVKS